MREVRTYTSFWRAYKRFLAIHPDFQVQITKVLQQLSVNAFETSLETHKLKGKYKDHYAWSAGYDLRIVFVIQKIQDSQEEIWLVNIGTHQEVYR
jgi:mRNA interferase YafQ